MKACQLTGSALVDLPIFQLVYVNFLNKIDFLKEYNK